MVKCHFTKTKFLVKLVPCSNLTADFAFDCITGIINQLERCGATVLSLINDNLRVNQAMFKKFIPIHPSEPWKVNSPSGDHPLFLIYDPVHILKNIRNCWHTEKLQKLKFIDTDQTQKFACWQDLKDIQQHESDKMLKLTKLNRASVFPRNLEKQKVSLVLDVFCDTTASGLEESIINKDNQSAKDTAAFIRRVSQLWKLLNCKSSSASKRHNDPDRCVIDDINCIGIQRLQHWANYNVLPKADAKRENTLSNDTACALSWSCNALASLAVYLLNAEEPYRHSYICLGFYQQDDLESHFGHFRMSAGGNYYITSQDVFATHNIDRARLMLQSCKYLDLVDSVHSCHLCEKPLTDGEIILLDDMASNNVQTVDHDTLLSLFYIGGYLAFKHDYLRGESSDFSDEVSSYLANLDRGSLQYPTPGLFNFIVLAYVFTTNSGENMCRNRLLSVFQRFPEYFDIEIVLEKQPLVRLSNIFFKRFCIMCNTALTVDDSDKAARKAAKLSSTSLKR